MRKSLLAAVVAVVTMFGLGGAFAASAEPGPNGKNDHGLCTAYFNGQKVGHGPGEDTDDPPPFQGLQETGEQWTGNDGEDNDFDGGTDDPPNGDDPNPPEHTDLTDAENIFNYCSDHGLIGGNPDHGRFTCFNQDDDDPDNPPVAMGQDDPSSPECGRNEKPGNGPKA